ANAGPSLVDGGGTNSSQFFFIYGPPTYLTANYTLWGRVITGLDIIKQVAAGGYDPDEVIPGVGGAPPTVDLNFNKVTVGPRTPRAAAPGGPGPPERPAATGSPGRAASWRDARNAARTDP